MTYLDAVDQLQQIASDIEVDDEAQIRGFVGDIRELLDWAATHPEEAAVLSEALGSN